MALTLYLEFLINFKIRNMKCFRTIFTITLVLIGLVSRSQIERVIVEPFYVSTPIDSTEFNLAGGSELKSGSTTYRIYIDLMPGSILKKIYGDVNHTLKIASSSYFFNNVDGVSFAKDFNNLNAHKNPTFALDSWLTIGQTTKPVAGKTNYGILKAQDRNGTNILTSNISLTNTAIPIPLTTSDGMDTIFAPIPSAWINAGIITPGGGDSTIFGSTKIQSSFISKSATLQNSGVRGVIPDSNQVLIAQLTTKGDLSFELNIEIEELVAGIPTIVKYVANDSILLPGEKYNSFLKFPSECGCQDPKYLEYDNKYSCMDVTKCLNLIVFGCMDTMACNFDSNANYSLKSLCCYPGYCNGREIAVVCPQVNGDNFEFEVYPNPTQGNLFLNTLPSKPKEIKYSVFDSFGTLVSFKNLGLTSKITNEEIDLSNINSGIYLIRIDYDGKYKSKLFLKN
jgi:hypothetical protein